MSLTLGPNLGLLVNGLLGEQHYNELMRQWRGLDALLQPRAAGILNAPPGSPADGDVVLAGSAPTGAFVGHAGEIARWSSVLAAWEFFAPKTGWEMWNTVDSRWYRYTGSAWTRRAEDKVTLMVPVTADGTNLATGTGKATIHMPYDMVVSEIFAGLTVAQATGATPVTVDVNKADVSVFTTVITIDNTEDTSLTAAVPPVLIANTELLKGNKVTVDIDAIGDAGAQGLKVYITGWVK